MSKKSALTTDYKYIHFECCLIGHVSSHVGEILSYGIVKYSKKFNPDDQEILKETIRLYFDAKLPLELEMVLEMAFQNYIHDGLRGYDQSNNFNPETEIKLINNYFLEDHHPDDAYYKFLSKCKIYVQLAKAYYALGLSSKKPENTVKAYNNINKIVQIHESKYGKDAEVMVKVDMMLAFRDHDKPHHEFEIFKAFLAIKSIQGKSDFTGTNKAFICARMIGAKTPEIAKKICHDKLVKRDFSRYNERYFFDKLIVELQVKGFIMSKITYGRSIYLSTQLNNELLTVAIMNHTEQKVIKTASAVLKNQERESRKKISNNLKNNQLK